MHPLYRKFGFARAGLQADGEALDEPGERERVALGHAAVAALEELEVESLVREARLDQRPVERDAPRSRKYSSLRPASSQTPPQLGTRSALAATSRTGSCVEPPLPDLRHELAVSRTNGSSPSRTRAPRSRARRAGRRPARAQAGRSAPRTRSNEPSYRSRSARAAGRRSRARASPRTARRPHAPRARRTDRAARAPSRSRRSRPTTCPAAPRRARPRRKRSSTNGTTSSQR